MLGSIRDNQLQIKRKQKQKHIATEKKKNLNILCTNIAEI